MRPRATSTEVALGAGHAEGVWAGRRHEPHRARLIARFSAFTVAKGEVEIGRRLKYRHDLASENGKAKRGWKGIGLLSKDHGENLKNESTRSDARPEPAVVKN